MALRTGTGENLSYMNPLGIDWQVAYVCVAVMVIVSLAALAAFGWRFRRTEGASQFLLLIGSALGWMITVLVMAIAPPEQSWFWLSIKYVFIAGAPIGLFLYALAITGLTPRWQRGIVVALAVVPVVTQVLLWGPDSRHWIISDLQTDKVGILTRTSQITFGPFYWVGVLQGYALILVSIGMLLVCAIRANPLVRGQLATMAVAALAPLIANFLLITGIAPRQFDPMPFGAAVMSYLIWWAIIRHRMVDLLPIARNRLMDVMDNAVLALDGQGRIIDCNTSMARLLQRTPRQLLGNPIARFLPAGEGPISAEGPRAIERLLRKDIPGRPVDPSDRQLLPIAARHYASRIVPLPARRPDAPDGRLLILDDVTERVEAEVSVERALAEVKTLRGLLPICAGCKQIKDTLGRWRPVDEFISENSEADLTHSVCPSCLAARYPGFSDLGRQMPES